MGLIICSKSSIFFSYTFFIQKIIVRPLVHLISRCVTSLLTQLKGMNCVFQQLDSNLDPRRLDKSLRIVKKLDFYFIILDVSKFESIETFWKIFCLVIEMIMNKKTFNIFFLKKNIQYLLVYLITNYYLSGFCEIT